MEAQIIKRLFCSHKTWMAQDPQTSQVDENTLSVTWNRMQCEGCGKVRHDNVLKAGEQIVVPWME